MTEKTAKVSQDIINMAREAKCFVANSGEDSLPDESLMRAAVTFNMLQRRGMIATVRHDDMMCKPHDFDDSDRAHAVALIASNFTDNPPSTPERAALFGTELPDDYAQLPQAAVAGNRRALGLPPQEQELGSAAEPEAIDTVMRAERERVLALVRRVVRDCPLWPHAVTSALQTLIQDIKNGEQAP